MKDSTGISPLKHALNMNSIPYVEMLISSLINVIGIYNLSGLIHKDFPQLFKMRIKSFHSLLDNCYFQTPQMEALK